MNTGRSRASGHSTARDKKERLRGFLIKKLRDRNGIVSEDQKTLKILNEEATRLLGKPASEAELRKAEKRLMKRLAEGVGPAATGARIPTQRGMGGGMSARGETMMTGRSAISNATSVLDEARDAMASARGGGGGTLQNNQTGTLQLPNVKEEGGYDYWLRFMEMDVRNFQREEQKRKSHEETRIKKYRSYLDEQVAMKAKAKKAARIADLSWGVEIKKDYDKWQEEALVAEAKQVEQRQRCANPVYRYHPDVGVYLSGPTPDALTRVDPKPHKNKPWRFTAHILPNPRTNTP